jgi:hypothetical protein
VTDFEHAKAKAPDRKTQQKGLRPGACRLCKISAVEGVRLKPVMKKRASDASSEGLSPDEYRRVIVRA